MSGHTATLLCALCGADATGTTNNRPACKDHTITDEEFLALELMGQLGVADRISAENVLADKEIVETISPPKMEVPVCAGCPTHGIRTGDNIPLTCFMCSIYNNSDHPTIRLKRGT